MAIHELELFIRWRHLIHCQDRRAMVPLADEVILLSSVHIRNRKNNKNISFKVTLTSLHPIICNMVQKVKVDQVILFK